MPKGARKPTAKSMVLAKARELQALDLRKSGATYEKIGEQLGITKEGARDCVRRALAELQAMCTEKAEEVRRIELERLDELTAGLWDKAKEGDTAAVAAFLRVMERRDALLALSESAGLPDAEDEVVGFAVEMVDRSTPPQVN